MFEATTTVPDLISELRDGVASVISLSFSINHPLTGISARRQPFDPGGALQFVDRQLIIVKGLKVEILRLAAHTLRVE